MMILRGVDMTVILPNKIVRKMKRKFFFQQIRSKIGAKFMIFGAWITPFAWDFKLSESNFNFKEYENLIKGRK